MYMLWVYIGWNTINLNKTPPTFRQRHTPKQHSNHITAFLIQTQITPPSSRLPLPRWWARPRASIETWSRASRACPRPPASHRSTRTCWCSKPRPWPPWTASTSACTSCTCSRWPGKGAPWEVGRAMRLALSVFLPHFVCLHAPGLCRRCVSARSSVCCRQIVHMKGLQAAYQFAWQWNYFALLIGNRTFSYHLCCR